MSANSNPPPANQLEGTLEAYYANLQRTDDNVEAIEQGINNAYIATATTRAAIQAVETFRDDAKQLSITVDTFKFVAKLMSKAGGLKPIGTALTKILERVDKTVEKVEDKAEEVDKKFKDKNLVERLKTVEDKLDKAGNGLGEVSKVLDVREAQAAAMIFALDSTAPYSSALATAVDLQVYDDNLALDAVNNVADPILQPVKDFNELVRVKIFDDFLDGVSDLRSVAGVFDGVAGPLNELYKLLKPVEDVLNAVGFIFDITVGWIIDWAFEALGINKLIDKVEEQINKLLPDFEILNVLDDAVDNILGDVEAFVNTPDFNGIADIDFNPRADVPSIQRWIDQIYSGGLAGFEDPDCGPILIGTTDDDTITGFDDEDDILDGGAGNDTLYGLGGDDILIGGTGDDTLFGGTDTYDAVSNRDGGDRAIYRGGVEEYSITQEVEDGPVLISHVRPGAGVELQGTDTLDGVEYAVFDGQEFLIEDLLRNTQIAAPGQTILRGRNEISDENLDGVVDDTVDDILIGLAGQPITIFGRGGDDRAIAGSGRTADSLYGGVGNDYLDPALSGTGAGTSGRDEVYGGTGIDTLSLRRNTVGEHVDLTAGRYLAAGESGDSSRARLQSERADLLVSIENVVGTQMDDALFGSDIANVLQGVDGDDLIDGRGGRDSIEGGKGDDILVGGADIDSIFGGVGNDVMIGQRAVAGVSDFYDGGDGIDYVSYTGLENAAVATSWGDLFTFGAPALKIIARADAGTVRQVNPNNNQTISTDRLVDVEGIRGSRFNDLLIGGEVLATLDGSEGNDTIITDGMTGDAIGGNGTDTIYTSAALINYYGGSFFEADDSTADVLDMSRTENVSWNITDTGAGTAQYKTANDPNATFADTGTTANGFERYIFADGDDSYYANVDAYRLISMEGGDDYANIGASSGAVVSGFYSMGDGDDELELFRPGTANMGAGTDYLYYANLAAEAGATLIGGLGDDTIEITAGTDLVIDGGANGIEDRPGTDFNDTDWLLIDPTLVGAVTINMVAGTLSGAITGTFTSIEKVNGTRAGDTVFGSEIDNQIMGADGQDTLLGGAGSDNIYGGTGSDTIRGDAGDDNIFGGAGSDVIYGGDDEESGDTVSWSFFSPIGEVQESGFGDLEVDLRNGTALLTWSSGSEIDTIFGIENVIGGVGADSLTGDNRSNVLSGGAANDQLYGLGGDDVLNTGDGVDSAYGGAGNDTVNVGDGGLMAHGGDGFDTLNLGELQGSLTYDFATDVLSGEIMVDIPVWADTGTTEARAGGLTPAQVLEADPLFHNDASDPDRVLPDTPETKIIQTLTPRIFNGMAESFERVQGGTATLTVLVTQARDVILGGTESVEIVSFANEIRGVTYNMATKTGTSPFITNDAYVNIDGLEGTSEDDTLLGDANDNTLYGGSAGDDTLTGSDGNDLLVNLNGTSTLFGGNNDDVFMLGNGGDTVRGGDGYDRVVIEDVAGANANDTVINLLANSGQGFYGRDKSFAQIEEFAFLFEERGTIIATNAADIIELAGSKSLRVLGGDDEVRIGADTVGLSLDGGGGTDLLDFTARQRDLTVSLTAESLSDDGNRARVRGFENVDGGDGDDLIVGSSVRNILDGGLGNDRVLGAGGDDFIDGNEGDDVLFGNTDDDLIIGGLGDDVLYGGGGIDRFLFLEGDGNDIIRDFQDNADKIWIRGGYSFADLTIEDTGPHVQVSFELNDITIHNIDLNRITAADFIFA